MANFCSVVSDCVYAAGDTRKTTPRLIHLQKGLGYRIHPAEGVFYKTEGVGGQYIGGSGKNDMVCEDFSRSCAARRAQLKNQPTLEHSLG